MMSILAMEKMNYILMPSLQHMTLIKIVTNVWNEVWTQKNRDNIRNHLRHVTYDFDKEWDKLEEEVIQKVLRLKLPKPLKEKIECFIEPISLEVYRWIYYHNHRYTCVWEILPKKFYWLSQGTVDYKKTAEAMINDNVLSAVDSYTLACLYCLMEELPKLWKQIPENSRNRFITNGTSGKCNGKNDEWHKVDSDPNVRYLVHFWTFAITQIETFFESIYRCVYCETVCGCMFHRSVSLGNLEASNFFLQETDPNFKLCVLKLTKEALNEPKDFLPSSDMLCFLLSHLDKEEEIEVIKEFRLQILDLFLKWPLQSLFMEMANRMWDYLDPLESLKILNKITNVVKDGCRAYDYNKLFREFWLKMPKTHKIYVVDKSTWEPALLSKLLRIKDIESFHLILKGATAEECIEIFSCRSMKNFFGKKLVSSPTKDIVQFVKEFKERMGKRLTGIIVGEDQMWNELFKKLDDYKNKKRTLEDGESRPAKKLCGAESEKK